MNTKILQMEIIMKFFKKWKLFSDKLLKIETFFNDITKKYDMHNERLEHIMELCMNVL